MDRICSIFTRISRFQGSPCRVLFYDHANRGPLLERRGKEKTVTGTTTYRRVLSMAAVTLTALVLLLITLMTQSGVSHASDAAATAPSISAYPPPPPSTSTTPTAVQHAFAFALALDVTAATALDLVGLQGAHRCVVWHRGDDRLA